YPKATWFASNLVSGEYRGPPDRARRKDVGLSGRRPTKVWLIMAYSAICGEDRLTAREVCLFRRVIHAGWIKWKNADQRELVERLSRPRPEIAGAAFLRRPGIRYFDRQLPPDRGPRRNEQIRITPIRLVGAEGEQLGIVPTLQA